HPTLKTDDLKDEAKVKEWMETLSVKLNKDQKSGAVRFIFNLRKDNELEHYLPHFTMFHHGVESEYLLSTDFFASSDYKKISLLGEKLETLIEEGAFVKRGEKIQEIESFKDALDWLMSEAR